MTNHNFIDLSIYGWEPLVYPEGYHRTNPGFDGREIYVRNANNFRYFITRFPRRDRDFYVCNYWNGFQHCSTLPTSAYPTIKPTSTKEETISILAMRCNEVIDNIDHPTL